MVSGALSFVCLSSRCDGMGCFTANGQSAEQPKLVDTWVASGWFVHEQTYSWRVSVRRSLYIWQPSLCILYLQMHHNSSVGIPSMCELLIGEIT